MVEKNPVQMYDELTRLGYVTPATMEPFGISEFTDYVDFHTTLAFTTPEVPLWNQVKPGVENAKLGSRVKGNTKRKKRSRNR